MKLWTVKKTISFKNQATGESIPMPCFIPAFRSQFEAMSKFKDDTQVECSTKTIRLNNYSNQYHAVMNFVFSSLPENYNFRTIGQFKNWSKVQVGFTSEVSVAGEVFSVPRSASHDECDQEDFMQNLYNPSLDFWGKILKMERAQLVEGSIQYSADLRYKSLRGHGGMSK